MPTRVNANVTLRLTARSRPCPTYVMQMSCVFIVGAGFMPARVNANVTVSFCEGAVPYFTVSANCLMSA